VRRAAERGGREKRFKPGANEEILRARFDRPAGFDGSQFVPAPIAPLIPRHARWRSRAVDG
jgi:hypothetical protein